jgi:hypothetical protein
MPYQTYIRRLLHEALVREANCSFAEAQGLNGMTLGRY